MPCGCGVGAQSGTLWQARDPVPLGTPGSAPVCGAELSQLGQADYDPECTVVRLSAVEQSDRRRHRLGSGTRSDQGARRALGAVRGGQGEVGMPLGAAPAPGGVGVDHFGLASAKCMAHGRLGAHRCRCVGSAITLIGRLSEAVGRAGCTRATHALGREVGRLRPPTRD